MPSTPYAASKIATTRFFLLEDFGSSAAILRPFNKSAAERGVYVGSSYRYTAGGGQPIVIYGDGEQTRDLYSRLRLPMLPSVPTKNR